MKRRSSLLGFVVAVGLILAAGQPLLGPRPLAAHSAPPAQLARTGPDPTIYLPLVQNGFSPSASPSPGADLLQAQITASGFDPPVLLGPLGSVITWQNQTSAPVTLQISAPTASGTHTAGLPGTLTVPAGGTASQLFPQSGTVTVTDESSGQTQTATFDPAVGGSCADGDPAPPPPAAPATLASPAPRQCPGITITAPTSPAPMPTQVADVSLTYQYQSIPPGSTQPITVQYQPTSFVRESFGGDLPSPPPASLLVNGDFVCATCQVLLTRTSGWSGGNPDAFPTVPGAAITIQTLTPQTVFSDSPEIRGWGVCTATNLPPSGVKDAPFHSGWGLIYDNFPTSGGPITYTLGSGSILVDSSLCPFVAPPTPIAQIYALEVFTPGISFNNQAAFNARRLPASDVEYKLTVDGTDFGAWPIAVLRPLDYTVGGRHDPLAFPADPLGGRAYLNTGEYTLPFRLFATTGQGVTTGMDLLYSSASSLSYLGDARLPNASSAAPLPFGQGWSYPYGARVIPVGPYDVKTGASQAFDLIGPDGQRVLTNLAPGTLATTGGLAWFGGYRLQLDPTTSGYHVWSPDSRDDYWFDQQGRLTQIGREGYATPLTISYNGSTQVITDSGGKVTTVTFTGPRVSQVTDPNGNSWSFAYTNDSLTAITQKQTGYRWQFAYDPTQAVLTQLLEPDCRLTTLSYAAGTEPGLATFGAFVGSSAAGSRYARTVTYPPAGSYPAGGQANVTDPLGATTTYQLTNATLSLVTITDALGRVSTLGDSLIPTYYTDPGGHGVTVYLDGDGLVSQTSTYSGSFTTGLYSDTVYGHASSKSVGVFNERLLASVTHTPSFGESLSFVYDTEDRPIQETDGNGGVTTIQYDADGRVTEVTSPAGRQVSYTYGTAPGQTNLIASETTANPESAPVVVSYTYDGLGNVLTVTDPRGHAWTSNYDPLGRLIKQSSPQSASSGVQVQQWAYDEVGRVLTYRDGRGNDTTYGYDPVGDLLAIDYPDGSSLGWTYDTGGDVLTATNQLGGVTTVTPDALGRPASATLENGTVEQRGYDPSDNVNALTVGNASLNLGFDPANNLQSVTYPSQLVAGSSFQPTLTVQNVGDGPPQYLDATVAPGVEIGNGISYDALWRPQNLAQTDGPAESTGSGSFVGINTFDPDSLVTGWTAPNAAAGNPPADLAGGSGLPRSVKFTYDGVGNPQSQSVTNGTVVATWQPDPAGNVVGAKVANAAGVLVTAATSRYDELNQLVALTDGAGETAQQAYDGNGDLVWLQDGRGCTTTYTYDPLGRVTHSETLVPTTPGQPSERVGTDATFDLAGNLTSITGPYPLAQPVVESVARRSTTGPSLQRQQETPPGGAPRNQAGFDSANRPKTVTRQGHTYTVIYRDGQNGLPNDGQPDHLADATGQTVVQFKYSAAGQFNGYVDSTGTAVESWSFDGGGRPTDATRGSFSLHWDYEHAGPIPSAVTWTTGGHSFRYTVQPDQNDLLGAISGPGYASAVTYQSTGGQLQTITLGNQTWTYKYYPNDQFWSLTYPNGMVTTATYDPKYPDRLHSWTVTDASGTVLAQWVYNYQPNGVVIVSQSGPGLVGAWAYYSDAQGVRWDDAYSGTGLVGTTIGRAFHEAVTYEPSGDLQTARSNVSPATKSETVLTYSYITGTQQVDQVFQNGQPSIFQAPDAAGNVAYSGPDSAKGPTAAGRHFVYDEQGRLSQLTDVTTTLQIRYDYLPTGELAGRTQTGGPGPTGASYQVNFGLGSVLDLDANFQPTATYVLDPGGLRLARYKGSGVPQQYIYNPNGSVAFLADADGHTLHPLPETSAFGAPIAPTSAAATSPPDVYGFAGRYRDPATGLSLFDNGTWYDPTLRRFLQPTAGNGTSPYQFNGLAPRSDLDLGAALNETRTWLDDPLTGGIPFAVPSGAVNQYAWDETFQDPIFIRLGATIQGIGGATETLAGGLLLFAPEPALTKAGGGLLALHGLDNLQAGGRALWSGRSAGTATSTAVAATARTFGASDEAARMLAIGTDIVIPIAGPTAVSRLGALSGRAARLARETILSTWLDFAPVDEAALQSSLARVARLRPAYSAQVAERIRGSVLWQSAETYPGTTIPRWFVLGTRQGGIWVSPNATEHLMERTLRIPAPRPLHAQMMIAELDSAVQTAVRQNIPFGPLVQVGRWELGFAPARIGQPLPVLTHALYGGRIAPVPGE